LVSLFTGVGGLDYGFEAAGFKTRVAVEIDEDCCRTIRANRPWEIIPQDIHKTTCKEILAKCGLKRSDVDILIGGPPCQPFSKSAYWRYGDTKRLSDPRANTLQAYMKCVEELRPSVFVLENVHGFNYSGKEEGFKLLQNMTDGINSRTNCKYKLSWDIINCADYGVPQLRTRFFLVGNRGGETFKFPNTTHFNPLNVKSTFRSLKKKEYITAWDAIGGLKVSDDADLKVKGLWGDLLPTIPEGENYLWHTSRKGGRPLFGWRTRYWSFLLKLAKNRPSWTIQAQPGSSTGPFHWENRLLSVEELKRLQTFPSDINIIGSRSSAHKQIGNAVPSLFGEVLGIAIKKQFFNGRVNSKLKLAVEPKRPIPLPGPVQELPSKYYHLIGVHPDHPGEGRGPIGKR
jgi:DNA (cytosine-5)-methyltransferase 1